MEEPFIYNLLSNQCSCSIYPRYEPWWYYKNPLFEVEELFLFRIVNVQVPPNSLQREEVNNNDLGRRSPWWGRRQEGTSDHHQCWSQFLVGFIHPVRWHPPDDGRLCLAAAARRCPCPSPHPWRRGLVSRWSSRTREAQWEEEQTANLSGAHLIFQANDRNRRDNFEK